MSTPESILSVVDFPAPLGPMYPRISPLSIEKKMSSTALFTVYSRWKSDMHESQKSDRRLSMLKFSETYDASIKLMLRHRVNSHKERHVLQRQPRYILPDASLDENRPQAHLNKKIQSGNQQSH
ncbi:MAG: hypothetical protein LBF60_07955 [Treponema sp.]|jgi:hypothetical protein|nr:hypothetical protein [Treponema sp.]